MSETREDGFLGGRLQIAQPVRGFRSGADAVMLAAACPAQPGETVLELGCGAGVASLCLGWRVPSLKLTGLERQEDYAALARRNAVRNDIPLDVVTGDLAAMPPGLREQSFDHVIANPPYFLSGSRAVDSGRDVSRQESLPLAEWIDAGLRRLKPGGMMTVIQRADRLDALLPALQARAGAVTILPVSARTGREAGRIILTARKGSRAPLRLLAPFVMHDADRHLRDGEDFSGPASAVLREGDSMARYFAKVP
ncbi:tRNA1(Val) (adenine(37)-N6)-methyltransferase [Paracoccus methylarcula]|uniref:Methyltransferase domain-containing protein n=1 Tax=Paracoccus methylarcula TaxID=72022 RepID=A0A3R7LLS4_9RHOB|nr:methyltransferase [Paracoccus methylarcula]RNF36181.1 methyltransferase domain-containing protein [Paracoccus methylarcula]